MHCCRGCQEATQGTQDQAQQQGQEQQETQQQGQSQVEAPDYEKQIAERDEKNAALEAQVAEAAKTAEAAEQLRGEVAEVKAQAESDRIDFRLQLAGVRNVTAARALLADHDKFELGQCERGLGRPCLLAADAPEGTSA